MLGLMSVRIARQRPQNRRVRRRATPAALLAYGFSPGLSVAIAWAIATVK
jgi:hypothetical protein